MKFQTQVKQVLGTPDQGAWSQVHHFIPDQEDKFLKRGELILLVSLGEISEDQPTASVGREIISRFHEEYYGNLDKKPMAALEDASKKVAKENSRYFDKPDEISLIGLVLWNDIAYLVIYYQGRIILRRDEKTIKLLDSDGADSVSASGFIKPEDIFVLGTTDFFEKLPASMITDCLNNEDLEKMAEILGPVVHAREDQGRLGAAMVKIGSQKEKLDFSPPVEKKTRPKKFSRQSIFKKIRIKPNFGFLSNWAKKISGLSVAIGFLVLLTVSIFFGWNKRREQQREMKIANLATQIDEKIILAANLRNLDPEESLNLINQAEEINQQLAQLDKSKSANYLGQMETMKQNLGEKPVGPEIYYDMNLVGENVEIESVYTDGQIALIFDRLGRRLVEIDLDKKSAEILAGGDELSSFGLVAFSNNRVYWVSQNTVYWLEDEELSQLLELDESIQSVSVGGWLGNLYLLDASEEEIWLFPSIDQGVGRPRPWLKSKAGLNFNQLVDMAIDGNIWLLSETGEVYKYLSGNKEDFQINLPSGIGKAKYLSVSQQAERLAFWDEENKIIWLFSKNGDFIGRQPLEVDLLSGIALSPDGARVYLFGKNKIYLVEFSL